MSLYSSLVLLIVAYVLIRILGLHQRAGVGGDRRVIDANEVTRELGVIFFDVVSAVVRFMRALYTFLSPHGARLFDPTFWRNIRDALVVGVRAYVAAAHRIGIAVRPPETRRSVPRATVSDDFDWTQVTDIGVAIASEFDRSMPPLVEASNASPGVQWAGRSVTSESSVTETKTSDTPVPFLMGERLAEGSGATTVLSSGINVCTSGHPHPHLAHTTSWYAVIVGREPGCYYSWHIAAMYKPILFQMMTCNLQI